MTVYGRWMQKPPIGTSLDRSQSLAKGLVWFAPCWENGGGILSDIVGGNSAKLVSGTAWKPGLSPATGAAPLYTSSTSPAVSGAWPTWLQQSGPWTIATGFSWDGTTTRAGFGGLLAIYPSSSAQAPVLIGWDSSHSWLRAVSYNSYLANGSSTTILANTYYTAAATLIQAGASSAVAMWLNGVQLASTSAAPGSPTWSTGSGIYIGGANSGTFQSGCKHYWAAVWNRVLTAPEHSALAQNPWQIFRPFVDADRMGGQRKIPWHFFMNNPLSGVA